MLKRFLADESGQISAELIIILAAVLAVVLVLVSQLQSTAKEGAGKIGNESNQIWKDVDSIAKNTASP